MVVPQRSNTGTGRCNANAERSEKDAVWWYPNLYTRDKWEEGEVGKMKND